MPGLKKVTSLPPLKKTLVKSNKRDVLELDELWSFVHRKDNQRWVWRKDNQRWVWLAQCRRTRQIVAYAIGDRSEQTCRLLWERIPRRYKRCVLFTDFWKAYAKVLPEEQHRARGKEHGQTNHVERFNNTLSGLTTRFGSVWGVLCGRPCRFPSRR